MRKTEWWNWQTDKAWLLRTKLGHKSEQCVQVRILPRFLVDVRVIA